MPKPDYTKFSLTEFLEDSYFVQWIVSPDPESDEFWRSFMINHPDRETVVQQASAFIRTYRNQDTFTAASGKDVVWSRINTTIKEQGQPIVRISRPSIIPLY